MARRALDQTLECIQSLDQARTPDGICDALIRVAGRFGVEHVMAGTIPARGSGCRQQQAHVLIQHLPKGWTERYFSHGYVFRDPTIRQVAAGMPPFLWSEIEPAYRDDKAERRVMDEASDYRLKNGFTIPLTTLEGAAAGFSFSGERLVLAPDERGMLTLLASYALGRAICLMQKMPPEASLSPRERETLQWAAEGKSEWEIGELMGISEHGVDKHMRAARRKLKTSSRTQAVAEALRQGLIA